MAFTRLLLLFLILPCFQTKGDSYKSKTFSDFSCSSIEQETFCKIDNFTLNYEGNIKISPRFLKNHTLPSPAAQNLSLHISNSSISNKFQKIRRILSFRIEGFSVVFLTNTNIVSPDLLISAANSIEAHESILDASSTINFSDEYYLIPNTTGFGFAAKGLCVGDDCQNSDSFLSSKNYYGAFSTAGSDSEIKSEVISLDYFGRGNFFQRGGGRLRLNATSGIVLNSTLFLAQGSSSGLGMKTLKRAGTGGVIELIGASIQCDGSFFYAQGGNSSLDKVIPGVGGRVILKSNHEGKSKVPWNCSITNILVDGGQRSTKDLSIAGSGTFFISNGTDLSFGSLMMTQKSSIFTTSKTVFNISEIIDVKSKTNSKVLMHFGGKSSLLENNRGNSTFVIDFKIDFGDVQSPEVYIDIPENISLETCLHLGEASLNTSTHLIIQKAQSGLVMEYPESSINARSLVISEGEFNSLKLGNITTLETFTIEDLKKSIEIGVKVKAASFQVDNSKAVAIDGTVETFGNSCFNETSFLLETPGILIQSQDIINITGQLYSGSIRIVGLGEKIILSDSIISAKGLGCQVKESPNDGAGTYNSLANFCGASGGSYGGIGALGAFDMQGQCKREYNSAYGSPFNFLYSGSGGGASSEDFCQFGNVGYGGGIISIKSKGSLVLNGEINASGNDGSGKVEGVPKICGAGSGGSIYIEAFNVTGSLSSHLRAEGGNSGYLSGAGGGGRIFFNITSSGLKMESSKSGQLIVSVSGGLTNVEDMAIPDYMGASGGSISSSFCRPGFGGPLCQKCPRGFYKSHFGPGECTKCFNFKDAITKRVGWENPKEGGKTNQASGIWDCDFKEASIVVFLEKYFWTIFSLLAFLVILALGIKKKLYHKIIFFIQIRRNRTISERILNDEESESESEVNSISENISLQLLPKDISYYIGRVYLSGANTPFDPWTLSSNDLPKELKEVINLEEFDKFAADLVSGISYSKRQRFLNIILALLSFIPLYLLVLKVQRRKRFQKASLIVSEMRSKYNLFREGQEFSKIVAKAASSNNFSQLRIDFLNYRLDDMNWSILKRFPLQIDTVGKGTYLNPFRLDMGDPVLRAAIAFFNDFSISQKELGMLKTHTLVSHSRLEAKEIKNMFFYLLLITLNVHLRSLIAAISKRRFTRSMVQLREFIVEVNEKFFFQRSYVLTLGYQRPSVDEEGNQSVRKYEVDFEDKNNFTTAISELFFLLNYKPLSVTFFIVFEASENASKAGADWVYQVKQKFSENLLGMTRYSRRPTNKLSTKSLEIEKVRIGFLLKSSQSPNSLGISKVISQDGGFEPKSITWSQRTYAKLREYTIGQLFFTSDFSRVGIQKNMINILIFLDALQPPSNLFLFLYSSMDKRHEATFTFALICLFPFPVVILISPLIGMIWLIVGHSKITLGRMYSMVNLLCELNSILSLIVTLFMLLFEKTTWLLVILVLFRIYSVGLRVLIVQTTCNLLSYTYMFSNFPQLARI